MLSLKKQASFIWPSKKNTSNAMHLAMLSVLIGMSSHSCWDWWNLFMTPTDSTPSLWVFVSSCSVGKHRNSDRLWLLECCNVALFDEYNHMLEFNKKPTPAESVSPHPWSRVTHILILDLQACTVIVGDFGLAYHLCISQLLALHDGRSVRVDKGKMWKAWGVCRTPPSHTPEILSDMPYSYDRHCLVCIWSVPAHFVCG